VGGRLRGVGGRGGSGRLEGIGDRDEKRRIFYKDS